MSSINIYGVSPSSDSIGPYHYIYRITNIVENKHYYGVRTSKNILPKEDLGTKYFSSSYDKEFIQDQKDHPENYKYKVIRISESRQTVSEIEVYLHNKFNVGINPNFYNQSKQTNSKFDRTGKITAEDAVGNRFSISVTDERFLNGSLTSLFKGQVTVKDSEGHIFNISNTDDRFLDGSLMSITKGTVVVKNSEGIISRISCNHPDYLSGKLVSFVSGCTNPQFKYYKQTPWGIFDSLTALEPEIVIVNCLIGVNAITKIQ